MAFVFLWICEEFLAYLDEWEKSVDERPGQTTYTKTQKIMKLSSKTLLGLRVAGTSHLCITHLAGVNGNMMEHTTIPMYMSSRRTCKPQE